MPGGLHRICCCDDDADEGDCEDAGSGTTVDVTFWDLNKMCPECYAFPIGTLCLNNSRTAGGKGRSVSFGGTINLGFSSSGSGAFTYTANAGGLSEIPDTNIAWEHGGGFLPFPGPAGSCNEDLIFESVIKTVRVELKDDGNDKCRVTEIDVNAREFCPAVFRYNSTLHGGTYRTQDVVPNGTCGRETFPFSTTYTLLVDGGFAAASLNT